MLTSAHAKALTDAQSSSRHAGPLSPPPLPRPAPAPSSAEGQLGGAGPPRHQAVSAAEMLWTRGMRSLSTQVRRGPPSSVKGSVQSTVAKKAHSSCRATDGPASGRQAGWVERRIGDTRGAL